MNIKVDLTDQLTTDALPERRMRPEGIQAVKPVEAQDDKVELSSEAQRLSSLKEMAMAAPDVRSEKVNGIMKKIETGDYSIDTQLIAERLIQDHIRE